MLTNRLERHQCNGCDYVLERRAAPSGSKRPEPLCPDCNIEMRPITAASPAPVTFISDARITFPHCRCAYFETDGTAIEGNPCLVHPNGCEHGRSWAEPCLECRDKLWGTPNDVASTKLTTALS
jgi:hypothetical protein